MLRILPYCFFLVLVLSACRDKYHSPVHASAGGYLVVEGFISADTAASQIHLSRSVRLDSAHTVAEGGAVVQVEAQSGSSVGILVEGPAGYYSANLNGISAGDSYRIHITTSSKKEYFSDYSNPRATPPIDSVTWTAGTDGVKIFVSTHDPAAQTINYHWEFDESWKYTSAYYSELIYSKPKFYARDSSQQIYTCYQSAASTTVRVASSAGLAKDEISLFPLTDISYATSNRLSNMYSINVKQRAISEQALNYYNILAKNTEQLGSIFDAQPSALTGNIHSASDAAEPVLGFIECSAKTEKRIFINRSQLPDVPIATGHNGCDTTKFAFLYILPFADSIFKGGANVPISGFADNQAVSDLVYSSAICVDCRFQGGSTTKPSYWP